ncbi:MAG: S8 family serine peptidase [Planctomycetota bacterium]
MPSLPHSASCVAAIVLTAGCASAPPAAPAIDPTPESRSMTAAPAEPQARTGRQPDTASDALQPKADTGVDRFLAQFPEADGRGVVVAIFDTGVDPAAPGMQVTTDGKPKIIDLVDASGSGDVDTSTFAEINDDGTITGLSGRTLSLSDEWTNPTGEYRVGLKPATELFPSGLVGRYMAERAKDRNEQHRALVADATRALAEFDRDVPEPTEDQLERRDDLQTRIDLLAELPDMISDVGPVFDCLVWHDGEHWRAAIDTDEDGDLAEELALTNFRTEREFGTFGDEDLLNFAVNVYNDGDILSIFTEAGAHGTHVAGTVAAHFPDQPELNGMAPGAQIVGVKIGDTRLGSSSVNVGFIRGVTAVIDNDADMINMSYGGPAAFPDTRYRLDQIGTELVNEHNVVFVSSAGNSGPALSTVGSPGGTTGAIIGVGAAISAEMMEAQYAVREGYGDLQYPWSSRGPTLDGDLGVDISAPGGAISPVPSWTLNKHQLMNGTSMSSPNACGGIALILSKLKAEGIPSHPAEIKRAIIETAVALPDQSPWAHGAGMLQVDAAYEHLVNYRDDRFTDVTFHAKAPGNMRGIYLREPNETDEPIEMSVSFTPEWLDDADNRRKTDFDMRLAIEATEPWIETASTHTLNAAGRSTTVRVDPTSLEPGAHFAQILGYDAAARERGPMFTLPVTIIKGIELTEDDDYTYRETITTSNGDLLKRFFHAPAGATWMDVIIERLDTETDRTLIAHMTQLREDESFASHNSRSWITFDDDDIQSRSMTVDGGRTVELALAQNWSSLGDTEFEVTVRFRGVRPEPSQIMIDGAHYSTEVDIHSPLRDANVRPSGSLTGLVRSVRPVDWNITPLDPARDMLPDSRQTYQLILDYEFTMPEDGKVELSPAASVVPHFWDEFESSLWRVTDEEGKVHATGAGAGDTVSLDEGDYALQLQIRHEDPDALAYFESASLMLTHEISAIAIKAGSSPDAALYESANFGTVELERGETVRAYLLTPTKLPDIAEPGDMLIGDMSFGAETELGGASTRPYGWPVAMRVPTEPNDKPEIEAADEPAEDDEAVAEEDGVDQAEAADDAVLADAEGDSTEDESDADEPTRLDDLADEIRELKIAALDDLMSEDDAEQFDALAAELLADEPGDLDVLLAQMHRAAEIADDGDTQPVIDAAEAVIAAVDAEALAAYLGVNHDEDADEYDEELAEEMAEQQDALIEAHTTIVMTLAENAETQADVETIETELVRLLRWGELESDDQHDVDLAIAEIEGRLGDALTIINARIDDEPSQELRERRIDLLDELGWTVWADAEAQRLLIDYPPHSPVF